MKNNLKFRLLLALVVPLALVQCQKNDNLLVQADEEPVLWDPTPQPSAVPIFEVIIREGVCLQGGAQLEALVRNNQHDNDLFSYQFQWQVDGVVQPEGALLPCASGKAAVVKVIRYPDGLAIFKKVQLNTLFEEVEAEELLLEVR